ncbi:MAG: RagB/SusD family nutrient uptake outer membrane protein, partial [Tannerellaceae bacterium]|nr:RagB/SusD family nutrient uptake outer membrane protein [Tannerellaceae bacterium]
MNKQIVYTFSLLTLFFTLALSSCFDLGEELYDHVEKKDYYTDSDALVAALLRPYEHVKWAETERVFWLQEIAADQLTITQKRDHWEDGGRWRMLHQHTWDTYEESNHSGWNACYGGVGYCNNMLEDIVRQNYLSLGLTEEVKEQHTAEMAVLRAYLQLILLDLYRIPPLSLSTNKPFETQDTGANFRFIEESILEHIDKLPVYPVSGHEGRLTQGAAAMILMRLYLNAAWYIDEPMWEAARDVAQDLVDGVYGSYELVTDWTNLWNAGNEACPEIIWSFPQARQYNYDEFYYLFFMHYKAYERFNSSADFPAGYNGCHLVPSYDPAGKLYSYPLGNPFAKYPDCDIRKREFTVLSQGSYEGLFLAGPQYIGGTHTLQTGAEEWGNSPLIYLDQVALYTDNLKGTEKDKLVSDLMESEKNYVITDERFSSLPSAINTGEENSGIRLVKYPVFPSGDPAVKASYLVVFRFTEAYYTLAETEFRLGNRARAEELLNNVRKRYY